MDSEIRPIVQPPPAPWRHCTTWAVGGLFQIGYAENSDLLLVLSSQGRGVFDCLTGEKLARDYDDEYEDYDPIRLLAAGFGPLEGQIIRMAGLFGGGLPRTTKDHWSLAVEAPDWPTHRILLTSPTTENPDGTTKHGEITLIGEDSPCELRAYGFSETGRSLVIALSCDLVIFVR